MNMLISIKKISVYSFPLAAYGLLLSLVICAQTPGYPNQFSHEEYLINSWTEKDGLPADQINLLMESEIGHLWLGTGSGAFLFDGLKFENSGTTRQGLPFKDYISAILETESQRHFLGTEKGLYEVINNEIRYSELNKHLSNLNIRALAEDYHGRIWIGTSYGLNVWNNGVMKVLTEKDGLHNPIITSLLVDYWGNLWIGTLQGGLARFNDRIEYVYGVREGLYNLTVTSLFMDKRGTLWIGTIGGLFQLSPGRDRIDMIPGTRLLPVTDITEDRQGTIWFGTRNDGIYRIFHDPDRHVEHFCHSGKFITAMISDRNNNVWAGLADTGLTVIRNRLIQTINKKNGFISGPVTTVLQNPAGGLWAGTKDQGLFLIEDDRVRKKADKKTGLPDNHIRVLYNGGKGTLWVGTADGGLVKIQNGNMHYLNKANGLPSDSIRGIAGRNGRRFWVACGKHVLEMVNGRASTKSHVDSLGTINVLNVDENGDLYIGTESGLYKKNGARFLKLLPESTGSSAVVSVFTYDANEIWVGTENDGLIVLVNGNCVSISKANGLPDDSIYSLFLDGRDRLWFSSKNGIFYIPRQKLLSAIDQNNLRFHFRRFDENEGMDTRQCMGYHTPSVNYDGEGNLFYPTSKGLCRINLTESGTSIPPLVHIEKVMGDGKRRLEDILDGQPLSAHSIDIHYTGFDYSAPDKIQYEFLLLKEGSPVEKEHRSSGETFSLRDLDDGDYTLQLKALSNAGLYSNPPETLHFKITFPLYQRPAFYFLFTLVLAVVIAATLKIQNKRKQKNRSNKYKTTVLSDDLTEQIRAKLQQLMEEEHIFLDANLSLGDLAKKLHVHSNYLSKTINETYKMNFNDYVNRYRIEEVKRRLSDKAFEKKSVLEIMYETGFYSKSVFNTAFKKFTGMTPSEFRKTSA